MARSDKDISEENGNALNMNVNINVNEVDQEMIVWKKLKKTNLRNTTFLSNSKAYAENSKSWNIGGYEVLKYKYQKLKFVQGLYWNLMTSLMVLI